MWLEPWKRDEEIFFFLSFSSSAAGEAGEPSIKSKGLFSSFFSHFPEGKAREETLAFLVCIGE